MAESPLVKRRLVTPAVTISERVPLASVDVRGKGEDPRFARAVASVIDVAPPIEPCTSRSGLFGSILWLGPDEWLVVSESQVGDEIAARLREALESVHAGVTDVSDARIACALRGADARAVLAKGCSIDLDPRRLRPGTCVQTLLAKASVLIHAKDVDTLEVYFARSLADYAWAWLENATSPYAIEG